jgi:hypothetical protein
VVRRNTVVAVVAGLLLSAGFVVIAMPTAHAGARASSDPSGSGLHVIPFPGTPDAAASSQVIFSSLRPSELRSVRVIGSRSGAHHGQLQVLPDGAGTAFVPEHPFSAGERVSVSAELSSPAAGTASGDPGATRLSFSFGVAVPLLSSSAASTNPSAAADSSRGRSSSPPTKSFHSRPDLHPTQVNVTSDPDTTSGDIFLTPDHTSQMGPMILNSEGQLVWFRPISGGVARNLEVQSYKGQRVLTYWQGKVDGTDGVDMIVNHSYQTVAAVHPGNGYGADLHDFVITRQNTALVVSFVPVKADLSSVGGPKSGYVWDDVIQEIDIPTGKVLWSWHAYGHIPLDASKKPPKGNYDDFFHLNTIQQLSDGNLLISSRNTWSVYKISKKTGNVLWTLGGRYNNFHIGSGANFEWQHDALRNGNTLTVFDDASSPQEESESHGKQLNLNVPAKTVTLIHSYSHNPPLLSSFQGSTETLSNGDVFVGWGSEPEFSEFTPGGRQIFNGDLPLGETSYRVLRFSWFGQPRHAPAMAVSASSNGTLNIWASWNGATDVAAWRVVGGSSSSSMHKIGHKAFYSFETQITLHKQTRYCAVQAMNGNGKVLGTSPVHSCRHS